LVPVPGSVLVGLPVVPEALIGLASTVLPALVVLVASVPLIVCSSPSRQTPWRGNAQDGNAQALLRCLVVLH
jgi:hypothetical protein